MNTFSTSTQAGAQATLRLAFYGRYSGELQRQSSIQDQLRQCREAALKLGGIIHDEHVYFDEAESGVTQKGRDGLHRLISAVKSKVKAFDGIVIDDTSRLGRNLTHVLHMTEVVGARGIFLYFAAQQLDSRQGSSFRDLLVMYGQQDERYSKGLAEKTSRGQRGRALKGLLPGGRGPYGYVHENIEHPWKKVEYGRPAIDGVRLVPHPEQVKIIERIFKMYVQGLGVRRIAATLNREKVPSPLHGKGTVYRSWRANTVKKMLQNERYIGLSYWNRTKTVIDPETDQKKHVPRPEHEWDKVEVPEWRIISDSLWQAARETREQRGERAKAQSLGGRNRTEASRKYLFSGHLVCGVCGASMTIAGSDRPGRPRYWCARHRYRGDCSNRRSILQPLLEEELLASLVNNLRQPSVHEQIVIEFEKEVMRRWSTMMGDTERARQKTLLEVRIGTLATSARNIIQSIEGGGPSAILNQRLSEIEAERLTVAKDLAGLQRPSVEQPTKEMLKTFVERKLGDLAAVMTADTTKARAEIDRRIGKLILTPVTGVSGVRFELTGDLQLFSEEPVVLDPTWVSSVKHCTLPTLKLSTLLRKAPLTEATRAKLSTAARLRAATKKIHLTDGRIPADFSFEHDTEEPNLNGSLALDPMWISPSDVSCLLAGETHST